MVLFFRRTSYINNILNASSSSSTTTASGGSASTNTATCSPSRATPAPGISTFPTNTVNNNNNNIDNERNDSNKSKTSVLAKEEKKMQGTVVSSFVSRPRFFSILRWSLANYDSNNDIFNQNSMLKFIQFFNNIGIPLNNADFMGIA